MPSIEPVTTTDSQTKTTSDTQEGEATSYYNIIDNLINKGKLIYSYNNILQKYESLSNSEFSELIWLFKYYDEIFDSEETENLEQAIKEGIDTTDDASMFDANAAQVIQHKIFKNLLFNLKQISFLDETGNFKEMTHSDLTQLYQKENFFTIGKIDMGNKLKSSLETLGFEISSNSKGIATERHDVGFKYFILSSEPINLFEYVNILEQDRSNEEWYENKFFSTGEEVPQFIQESDVSFTYLKSNYVYQSEKGRMSLKGVNKELSSTETTTDTPVVSTNDTGYFNV